MDTDTNQAALDAKFAQLPLAIQELISDGEWKKWVGEIAKRNGLMIDQAGELETEIFILMIGMQSTSDLENNLHNSAGIPKEKIPQLLSDVNTEIIQRLKSKLMAEVGPEEKVISAPETTVGPEHRDAILAEIEKPTESEHGVFSNPNIITVTPVAPATIEKPITVPPTPIKVEPLPANILETKMTAVVKSVPETAPASKIDPYRELPN